MANNYGLCLSKHGLGVLMFRIFVKTWFFLEPTIHFITMSLCDHVINVIVQ
jgi:hypothetical protein